MSRFFIDKTKGSISTCCDEEDKQLFIIFLNPGVILFPLLITPAKGARRLYCAMSGYLQEKRILHLNRVNEKIPLIIMKDQKQPRLSKIVIRTVLAIRTSINSFIDSKKQGGPFRDYEKITIHGNN